MKNSLAPARIACRMRSGSAVSATAKTPAPDDAARRRSIVAMPDEASPRRSTMTMSGGVLSRAPRPSSRLTGTAAARTILSICFRNPSSSLTMRPTSWAMANPANARSYGFLPLVFASSAS